MKPKPFLVDEQMLPYADRIKLRASEIAGSANLEVSKALMASILTEKKIDPSKAEQAIREALDAAATHLLALPRFQNRRGATARSLKYLDELILKMEMFASAVSVLPPISKGYLNRKAAHLLKQHVFDTEVFFDLIKLFRSCLPEVSPKKTADDALRIIEPQEGESSSRIFNLWDSIPSITRVRVERRIEDLPTRSGVELLRLMPVLLREFRPATRRGAPHSLRFEYVRVIDGIWRRLDLKGRRRFTEYVEDHEIKSHHVKSPFQIFCDAALNCIGDPTAISIRQVSNLKRGAVRKREAASSS